MRASYFLIFVLLSAVILPFHINQAQIPRLLPYQGVYTDGTGEPVEDGTYEFIFALYDSDIGGNSIWTETDSLSTTNGLFYTFLGSSFPFPETLKFNRPFWLGISVEGNELGNRIPLASVAYSFYSLYADSTNNLLPNETITNAHISPTAQISDTKIYGTGETVSNFNADMVDGIDAIDLSSSVQKVVRGIIHFEDHNYEVTQNFSPSIDPSKSFVALGQLVFEKGGNGNFYRGESGCLISLTSNRITVAVNEPFHTPGLISHRLSFQIIEYR